MSLLQLPPEALRSIFEQIGSLFFRQDLNRLTICKQWYAFALPECQRRVTLSDGSLARLFSIEIPARLDTIRNNCKSRASIWEEIFHAPWLSLPKRVDARQVTKIRAVPYATHLSKTPWLIVKNCKITWLNLVYWRTNLLSFVPFVSVPMAFPGQVPKASTETIFHCCSSR